MKNISNNLFVKKPGSVSFYTKENIDDLLRCAKDVIYFIEKYIKIQHPTKGSVNFKLYPFQKEMIKTFENYKYVIALTGRQLGKCVSSETEIYYNDTKTELGNLVLKYLNFSEKITFLFEKILLKLIILKEINKKKNNKIENFFMNFLIYFFKSIVHKLNDKKIYTKEKFTHIIFHDFCSYPYVCKKIFRTKPLECWMLRTNNRYLFASGDHILFDKNMKKIYLKDCVPEKTFLTTEDGIEPVKEVKNLNFKIHMYDVEVDHPSHLYFTNGIASHNTTCASAFILWKAIFNEDQTILIAANKLSSALEIMSRIRFMYEELPDFLKPGVTVYNKSSVQFDNRSRIISRPTTPDAGRGLSVSLLYCLSPETKVVVRNKRTGIIEILSLKELYEKI
ncbi:MAG: hypothetical protein QXF12_01500 [Candidatus Aenigmatarchaeota archaeon]